jgi:hypothetical protein
VFGMTLSDAATLPVVIQDGVVTEYHDVFLTHQVHDVNLYLDVFRGQSWSDTNDGFGNPTEPTPGVWHCMARDTQGWQAAYQIYEYTTDHTQGRVNDGVTVLDRSPFTVLDPQTQQDATLGHPILENIGQLGRLLSVGPGTEPNVPFSTIGERLTDPNGAVETVFVDLTLTRFSNLFQYLTVMDPANYGGADDARVKGRININTAPWTVLQGLPGLDLSADANLTPERSIALYREIDPNHVYQSVGDLMQVPEMVTLGQANVGLVNLKLRDQMFTRMADLATVRSDVFTAYILVRMGINGPQKRYLAVLDRSQVDDAQDRIRILALQPVPESR